MRHQCIRSELASAQREPKKCFYLDVKFWERLLRQWGQRQFLYFPRRLERASLVRGTEAHQHPFSDAPHWNVSPQASQVEGCLEAENKANTFWSMLHQLFFSGAKAPRLRPKAAAMVVNTGPISIPPARACMAWAIGTTVPSGTFSASQWRK